MDKNKIDSLTDESLIKENANAVPKIINYVWLGKKEKPQSVLDCIASWQKFCPDYQIVEWNETNFDIDSIRWVKEAMQLKKYAFAADVIRFYALYQNGGIYLDTDVYMLKPFDNLLESGNAFIAYENGMWLGTAVIGAPKAHKWIKFALDYYKNRPLLKNGKINATSNVMAVSASVISLYGIKLDGKMQDIDDLSLLTYDYFFPKDYMTLKTKITENSFALHDFARVSSWWSNSEKRGASFARGARKVLGKRIFGLFERLVMNHFVKKELRFINNLGKV